MEETLISTEQLALLKTIALVFFFVFFVVVLGWLVFSGPQKFKAAARIPLDDHESNTEPINE